MNRIVIDYYRRWAWVLGLAAAGQFGLGWLMGNPQFPFEFYAFLVSCWSGATLLSFDFRRGALRPLVVLPVTGAQMGRSWWIATVPVPALVLAVLLFSGAALHCNFGMGRVFPVQRLVLSSLFTLVWLGGGFTMVFNCTRAAPGNTREFVSSIVLTWGTIATFFGSMLFCLNASHSVMRSGLLLVFGTILTVAGWFLAKGFDPAWAGLYLGRVDVPNLPWKRFGHTLEERSSLPLDVHTPRGVGGILFLLRSTCFRTFAILSAMIGLMVLCSQLQRSLLTMPHMDIEVLAAPGGFMLCWFTLLYRFTPALQLLRGLRTLPVSSSRLSAVVLAMALLPPLGLAALAGALVWLLSGKAAAVVILNCFLFPLAATAVCVCVLVWRGTGTRSQALLFVILFGAMLARFWLQAHFNHTEPPVIVGVVTLVACVALGFLLILLALTCSSRAYRLHGGSLALPWGAVR